MKLQRDDVFLFLSSWSAAAAAALILLQAADGRFKGHLSMLMLMLLQFVS